MEEAYHCFSAKIGNQEFDRCVEQLLAELTESNGAPVVHPTRFFRGSSYYFRENGIDIVSYTNKFPNQGEQIFEIYVSGDSGHIHEISERALELLSSYRLPNQERYEWNGLVLDMTSWRFTVDGNAVYLTKVEMLIMKLMMISKGKPLNQEQIYRDIWEEELPQDSCTIDTTVSRINKKARRRLIKNVPRIGYKLA